MTFSKYFWLALCTLALTGCATSIQSSAKREALDPTAKWVLLPIANNTDTPQAGLSAEAMVEHQLRTRGILGVQHYPASLSRDSLFEPTERKVTEEAQAWARGQGARYAVLGSVQEWRYKVGIDGEPAVGIALKVLDLSSGEVAWSASGAKSGWSREALSAVAQSVLAEMLNTIPLASSAAAK